jgi:hypothetical protein
MSIENITNQPLPKEGESYDVTPLELSHVNDSLHAVWLRAISIVWNESLNSLPWGRNQDGEWTQITKPEQDIEAIYDTYEDFLIAKPVEALSCFGFNNPDVGMKDLNSKAMPALKILRYEDLGRESETFGKDTDDNVSYKFQVGKNGWYSKSKTAASILMPQLTLVIPPKPENDEDQGMALVDYKLAGLSYPFTACA